MDMIHISINEKLKEEGKSAYWLAQQADLNHTTLSQIRNNKNKAINLEFLDRICAALECEPGDILQRVNGQTVKKAAKKKGARAK